MTLVKSTTNLRVIRQKTRSNFSYYEYELEKILAAPTQTAEPKIIQLRDKVILELFFSTGLKLSELANLKKDDINLTSRQLIINSVKDKIRKSFFSNQAYYWLKQYWPLIQNNSSPYLFLRLDRAKPANQSPKNLTARSLERLIEKYSLLAGLKPAISPEILRQNFKKQLLARGEKTDSVKKLLGYQSK